MATPDPAAAPSPRPGMGTILYEGGVAFRVWAPFAPAVFAAGTFNGWSAAANPFAREDGGFWSVEVPGAKVGDEYQFVIPDGGAGIWRKNPYASAVVNSSGNAIIHDPSFDWGDEAFAMPPWNELVIYEMHVGTFNEPDGGAPGTFDEIVAKLPYLGALGVNAIEIMPVSEFQMDKSWGYNPAQPFAVESSMGGPQGLFRFVKAAHAQGIAVILDVVYNHLGPGDLDLWRFDGWSDAAHDGGIYFYDNGRAKTPWGDTRPDYGRPEVRQYLRDNALFWLDKYRLDGLRFDAVNYIRNRDGHNDDPGGDLPDGWNLLRWINDEIRASQPGKIAIAEDMQDNEWVTLETSAGGAGFGSQWDAAFVGPIRAALVTPDDAGRDLLAVRDALAHFYNGRAFQRVVYTESHDAVSGDHQRLPEEISPGQSDGWFARKRSTLGAALVFTAPGIPMIFQGQEFLEGGAFTDQVPLDWSRLDQWGGIQRLYADLIGLRRNLGGFSRGLLGEGLNVHHVNDQDKVLAFHRWDGGGPGDDVVVLANFGNRSYDRYALGFPRPGQWRVRFNSDARVYCADFGDQPGFDAETSDDPRDGMAWQAEVGLGAYAVLILSQDP
jgi:1,4-alpha-glucan branching enzyme